MNANVFFVSKAHGIPLPVARLGGNAAQITAAAYNATQGRKTMELIWILQTGGDDPEDVKFVEAGYQYAEQVLSGNVVNPGAGLPALGGTLPIGGGGGGGGTTGGGGGGGTTVGGGGNTSSSATSSSTVNGQVRNYGPTVPRNEGLTATALSLDADEFVRRLQVTGQIINGAFGTKRI